MFLQSDYDTIQGILNLDDFPPEVEIEYVKRIKMKHVKQTGPLGVDSIVAMLRHLGFEVAPRKAAGEEAAVNWREIIEGSRIEAKDELGWKKGAFAGMVDDGIVSVFFDNDEARYEFMPHQVRLMAAPDLEGTEDEPLVNPNAPAVDRADRTPKAREIALEGDWSDWVEGQSAYVELDGDIVHGEFVEVGPADGEISVYVDGNLRRVPEKTVSMAD